MDEKKIISDIEKKIEAHKSGDEAPKSGIQLPPIGYKQFGNSIDLGNKYSITIGNNRVFLKWNEENQTDSHNDNNFNWSNCFEIPDTFTYKSTNLKTEANKIEKTGYLIPHFNNINSSFTKLDYIELLAHLSIKPNQSIEFDKISNIKIYRDMVEKQLLRQVKVIASLNLEIVRVLKVFYYHVETELQIGNNSLPINQKLWSDFTVDLKELFQTLLVIDVENFIDTQWEKFFTENSTVPKYIRKTTRNGLITILENKKPIKIIAEKLAGKLFIIESILEDAFLNSKLKSEDQILIHLKDQVSKKDIVQKANTLKVNGMSVEDMFNEIKKWLLTDLGFTNSELQYRFGFRFHEHEEAHHTFNKFVNDNHSNTIKNG